MNARSKQMLIIGGVVGGGLLLWMLSKSSAASAANATAPAAGAGSGPATIPPPTLVPISLPSGVYSSGGALYSSMPAVTVPQVNQQASIWNNLKPASAPAQAGYVNFPSGSQADVALLPWRTDGSNFYTQWAGIVYAVPLSTDQYGNYTAVTA